MSHQVCHCGWKKVTTYHGLRTHQGKMGCTPKGMHIPENNQFNYVPISFNQPSLLTSADLSFDLPRTPLYFDLPEVKSLQTCHCGWSNVTTYHGLRTHQGMMGCTPKGLRIPESSQIFVRNMAKQPHQTNNWVPIKQEDMFMSPNFTTQLHYGMRQSIEQGMHTPMIQAQEDSQQLVPVLKATKSQEYTFGSETTSQLETWNYKMSSSLSQIPPTESNTSFFQTPPRSHQGSGSSDKASRMLDFSSHKIVARQDTTKDRLQQQINIREEKMAEVKSDAKSCKVSLDAEWQQINSVFSDVIRAVEDARQKALEPLEKRKQRVKSQKQNLLHTLEGEIKKLRDSVDELDRNPCLQVSPLPYLNDSKEIENLKIDTSLSFGTLRATTSTMMKEIQRHLENLSSLELKRAATFAVDVKLDSETAHRCLELSNDGKVVRDGGAKTKLSDTKERFDLFGSVLGINGLNSGRSYWEVEVKNKTGWDLGVARRGANRKGILKVNSDNGYWVAVHFEDTKYAALTVPPTSLPLKEKPQKVGVFIDYEEGIVSFYDVKNKLHIFSFTDCHFRHDVLPYFSPHLKMNDKNADPLIISAV